jgi:hypothetical protein
MYSLLVLATNPEFNPRTAARALDLPRPTMTVIVIFYQAYGPQLAPRNRIGCTDPVQQPSGQAGHSDGGDQTGEQTDDRYGQSLPKNEFEDIASLRSDGDANAELTRALADRVSHHSVKSNCGQRKCE